MTEEDVLPVEVIDALKAGRKVDAIKRLRKLRGIGLTESKQLVDAYIESNPGDVGASAQKAGSGYGQIVLLIVGVFLIFGIYRYFT
ncbi:MAG: 50S ribosomal protein L7/L12 [Pseudomonadota bacterium]